MRNKNQKGFTLIELLVVIAIIGLLASVVLLALNSARAKSRDAKRLADIRQLASALELYFNDYDGYPATISGELNPTYIGQIPNAPTPPDGECGAANNYTYTHSPTVGFTNKGKTLYPDYTYTFCLGANTGGYNAGSATLSPRGIVQ